MEYKQEVIIKNIDTLDVIRSFHNHNFIEFLILLQPVKINSWKGIDTGQKASFSFWFFGWRQMSVVHENYKVSRGYLQFEDIGDKLPFGILNWKHKHIIKAHKEGALIIDEVWFEKDSKFLTIMLAPLMLFPIFIRKLTYRIWFYLLEGKHWTSFRRIQNDKALFN